MFKRLTNVKIGIVEFLWKFLIVLLIIMPVCMGICFWIGVQADAVLNIHLMKFIMPFVGSAVGFFFTTLLIMTGHGKEVSKEEDFSLQSYSERLVSRHIESEELASFPKMSIPSRRMTKVFL
jgi:hypothetical protein